MSIESFTGIIKQFSAISNHNKHFRIKDEITGDNIKFSYDERIQTKLQEDARVAVIANVIRDGN
ncbi:MAG: hypothetical protein Q4E22_05810 [Coriobacteriia bacterium]|nr:hypothetical protein [Coriobacteriia bacterium]